MSCRLLYWRVGLALATGWRVGLALARLGENRRHWLEWPSGGKRPVRESCVFYPPSACKRKSMLVLLDEARVRADLDKAQAAPLGEVVARRLTAALAEACPGAGLDVAQLTPLSDAHLGQLYMEQQDFLHTEIQAAIARTFVLNKLLGAEHTVFDFLTARRRELDRARENEQLEAYDLIQRRSRLQGELRAAGLTVGTHPATGERCIRTIEEQYGHRDETGPEDTESVLCAGASAAVHVRLRPSRSAHPQD